MKKEINYSESVYSIDTESFNSCLKDEGRWDWFITKNNIQVYNLYFFSYKTNTDTEYQTIFKGMSESFKINKL